VVGWEKHRGFPPVDWPAETALCRAIGGGFCGENPLSPLAGASDFSLPICLLVFLPFDRDHWSGTGNFSFSGAVVACPPMARGHLLDLPLAAGWPLQLGTPHAFKPNTLNLRPGTRGGERLPRAEKETGLNRPWVRESRNRLLLRSYERAPCAFALEKTPMDSGQSLSPFY